jgi:hypothetical protein
MRAITLALLAVVAAPLAAQAEKDPLRDLLKSDGGGLCYRRDYDAAHLRRHPRQATQSVVLSFRKDAMRVALRQKGRDYYIIGSCSYSDRAGLDTSGKPLIKAFKGPGGYDCIVMIEPGSAEEGGYVLIDLAGGDAGTLSLHTDDSAKARRRLSMKDTVIDLKFGTDDREFRLARTDDAACRAMDKVLKGP